MKALSIVLVVFPLVVQLQVYSGVTSASSVTRGDSAELRLFSAAAAFSVESAVLLNDVNARARELGYKIKAHLHVAPVWEHRHQQYLLKFDLLSPKLHLRGKHVNAEFLPHGSIWDSHSESTFYAHWKWGSIQEVYLDPAEPVDILNYKKSLASLFQFQTLDGVYNETDISGTCDVLYETISMNVFRKIKRSCSSEAAALGVVSSVRRATRYTLQEAGVEALHADELVALGEEGLGLKVRSWVALQRLQPAPPGPQATPAPDLAAALAALPPALRPLPLELDASPTFTFDDEEDSLEAALARGEAALGGEEAGAGGGAAAAAALSALVEALRAATRDRVLALLHAHPPARLPALCRALGLAAAPAPHRAAAAFLRLHAPDPLEPLARAYLAGVALALRPAEPVVRDLLRRAEAGGAGGVAPDALLAAAAAASRLPPAPRGDALAAALRWLARCPDEACRDAGLRALANLRSPAAAEPLLEHAARGAPAALAALAALPAEALPGPRVRRLLEVALRSRAPLDARAAALDLAARRSPHVAGLAWPARALAARAPRDEELRRLLWQRLEQRATAAELAALLEGAAGGWAARAAGGTTSVVARPAWSAAAAGWTSTLDSVQVAERGVLRRGRVRLLAAGPGGARAVPLEVEVWTRGLDALAGGGGEEAGEDGREEEETAGGLAVAVGGAWGAPVELFSSRAELLGHVWAGTGSAGAAVARAGVPLAAGRAAVPVAGGAVVTARWRAALALALDAAAQASLWYRSAHASLRLRAGAAAEARAGLETAWGRVEARAGSAAEARLGIAADLDFYGPVALCARVSLEPLRWRRDVALESQQGARRLRVRRGRREAGAGAGRSLALGRPNDAVCRTLRAAEADADPDPGMDPEMDPGADPVLDLGS